VVEQAHHGDLRGGPLVREPQLGDIPAHRRVQLDPPVGDQAQQRGRRVGLGDRAQQEQRVLVDRERVVDAGHAVAGVDLPAVGPHPDRDAGNAELGGRRLDELRQRVK
jgi:hypothetical protein